MKLYDAGKAPNPRKVRIFLAEKGVSVPTVPVDLAKLDHKSEAMTRLNPRQRMPVLELDDGTIITESTAICRYFEALHPTPDLFGRTPVEIGLVDMWTRRIEFDFYGAAQAVYRHGSPVMASAENQVPEWAAANQPRVQAELAFLDAHLRGRDFLALERFSYADICALTTLDFLRWAKVSIPESLTDLRRYHAALQARPSASA